MDLKQETLDKIDALVPRYPEKRSATLPLLHLVQEDQGHISKEAIVWIAKRLDLQPINVYEVVTFYPSFHEQPLGKKHVRVCRTLPCALSGSYKTCAKLQEELGAPLNGVSEDGEYSIEFAECLADCGAGPVVLVGDDLHQNITEDAVPEFVRKLKEDA